MCALLTGLGAGIDGPTSAMAQRSQRPPPPPSRSAEPSRQPVRANTDRYVIRGEVVFDRQTGLEWRRCSVGRVLRNDHCVGRERQVTWLEATQYEDGDWHAPTPEQLHSLWQRNPSGDPHRLNIDGTAFPDLAANRLYFFWTTESKGRTAIAVDFKEPYSARAIGPDWIKELRFPLLVVRDRKTDEPAQVHHEAAEAPAMSATGRFRLRGGDAEDVSTHLVWQRCPAGMKYSASLGCVGVLQHYRLDDARRLGSNGWRLPTRDELLTLVVKSRAGHPPMIDESAFPGMGTQYMQYWTNTRYDSGPQVWCVDFTFGSGTNCGPYPLMARLVRSSAAVASSDDRAAPTAPVRDDPPPTAMSSTGRFRLRGGEAEDVRTRLVWQRCPVGMAYSAGRGCVGTLQRFGLGDVRGMGSDGWRLPTRDELMTLVVKRRAGRPPMIDESVFPGMGIKHLQYWSSTRHDPDHTDQVWCVDFAVGVANPCGRDPSVVRLVRLMN